VLSQFTPEAGSRWGCLGDYIDWRGVYAAGRLDADSEGLLLLTDQGRLQQRLTDPAFGHWRRYWVQVEGDLSKADPISRAWNPVVGALRPPRRSSGCGSCCVVGLSPVGAAGPAGGNRARGAAADRGAWPPQPRPSRNSRTVWSCP
jgi:hypothetical protein